MEENPSETIERVDEIPVKSGTLTTPARISSVWSESGIHKETVSPRGDTVEVPQGKIQDQNESRTNSATRSPERNRN